MSMRRSREEGRLLLRRVAAASLVCGPLSFLSCSAGAAVRRRWLHRGSCGGTALNLPCARTENGRDVCCPHRAAAVVHGADMLIRAGGL